MILEGNWKKRGFLILLYLCLAVVIFFLLVGHIKPKTYEYLQVGDRSTEKIISPIEIEDIEATNRAKNRAANDVQMEYTQNDEINENQKRIIDAIYNQVKQINADETLKQNERVDEIARLIPQLSEVF